MEKVCPECRKPLTKKQIYRGFECCSFKCSNIRKGRKLRGKPHKMLHVMSDRQIAQYAVQNASTFGYGWPFKVWLGKARKASVKAGRMRLPSEQGGLKIL